MAKDRGIVLKFNKDLAENVTGLNPPVFIEENKMIDCLKDCFLTADTPSVKGAFDNDSSTYWVTSKSSITRWFQLDFGEGGVKISKVHIIASNIYEEILIKGSNDGVIFEEVLSSNVKISNTEYVCEVKDPSTQALYSIIKVFIRVSSEKQTLDIRDIKVYADIKIGNKGAFTVVGKEFDHLNGSLVDSIYVVNTVEKWKPDDSYGDKYIVLKLNEYTRMRKPEGSIKVIYKKALGNLKGKDSARIEDFEIEFMPSDLILLPNPPPTEENIKIASTIKLDLVKVEHKKLEIKDENIKVSSTLNLNFTNVTGMYP